VRIGLAAGGQIGAGLVRRPRPS